MLARLLGLNVRALRIFGSTALCLAWVAAGRASAFQHAQSALPWQYALAVCLGRAPAPLLRLLRARLARRLWAARHSQEEAGPRGTQPLPRVLARAASKPAADVTAFDHAGLLRGPAQARLP